jgi:hypothetical protein
VLRSAYHILGDPERVKQKVAVIPAVRGACLPWQRACHCNQSPRHRVPLGKSRQVFSAIVAEFPVAVNARALQTNGRIGGSRGD